LYCAALLSKESGLILLFFIAAYTGLDADAAETPGPRARRLAYSLSPFLAVTVIYTAVRVWALRGFAHTITPLPLATVVFTIPSVLVRYMRMVVWPRGLGCYYDTPYFSTASLCGFCLPAAILTAVVAGLVFWYWRHRSTSPARAKALAFAAIWMGTAVLPVLNFRLLPEGEIVHDRYAYLPMVGIALLAALAIRRLAMRLPLRKLRAAWAMSAAGVMALILGVGAVHQSLYWSDDLTLYHRAHEIAPHNPSATTSLAATAAARGMDDAAMALYKETLAMHPDFWRANLNLAYLQYAHGDFAGAVPYFQKACAVNPWDGEQFLYLGMSLLRAGRSAEAEKAVRTALLVRPGGANYHVGLAMVLLQEGKIGEAKQEILRELGTNPGSQEAATLLRKIDSPKNIPPG
jgi:hypothetical protein